jgi:hypothetical protein
MKRNSISEETLCVARKSNAETRQGISLHCSRGVLFAMMVTVSGWAHAVESGASAADSLQQTGLDVFKQFMASPPVIEGLLYEKMMARDNQKGLADGVLGTNGRVTYGFAKWQPGCLYLKLGGSDLVAAPNLQSGEEIDAMLGVEHWRIDPIGLCAYWKDSAKQPEQIRMGPSRLFHQRSDDFKQVLNMGVMHLEPGAIKWAGDTFIVSGYVPEAKAWVEVEGTIRPGPDGRAQEMTVKYVMKDITVKYRLRYGYVTNVPDTMPNWLPNNIEAFLMRGSEEIKLMRLRIMAFKTSPAVLPHAVFNPEGILAASRIPVLLYKDGNWYETNALGHLALAKGSAFAPDRLRGYRERFDLKQLYFGAAALGTAAAFSASRRILNKTKTKQPKGILT